MVHKLRSGYEKASAELHRDAAVVRVAATTLQ